MDNVLEFKTNPDIVLDPEATEGMPADIKQRLLDTLTLGMQRYGCDWTELEWRVDGNGVISVKRKT